jgi:hypothetical protein
MEDHLVEMILPLVTDCAPLRVKVTIKVVKDKFYIHFDGSKTYKDATDWDKYWISFEEYVVHVLSTNNFTSYKLNNKSNVYIIANIGSLFDFLKRLTNV